MIMSLGKGFGQVLRAGLSAALLLLLVGRAGSAEQTLRVDKFVLSGGGGESAGGKFGVTGTIGQPEGDQTLVGGRFGVDPGFWSAIGLVQLPGSPLLQLRRIDTQVLIVWPLATIEQGFVIEESASMEPSAIWRKATGSFRVGGDKVVLTVAARPGLRFFRLKRP